MNPAAVPHEQAIVIACEGEALLGIVHHPGAGAAQAAQATGVVIIVGGPQTRVGSHRQFVHLARALAAAGHPVLRFDVRGMGDSTGALHAFEQISPDIGAAIDALQRHAPQVRQVVLWGLCDGASAALLYLHDRADARVRGLCLLNPWVRSEASLARTHVKHYYLQRLAQREFWAKLFRGRVGWEALGGLAASVRMAAGKGGRATATPVTYQQRMAIAWRQFDGPVLLVLSGNDYTAKEFAEYVAGHVEWQALLAQPLLHQCLLPHADHTFSALLQRVEVEAATITWLAGQVFAEAQGAAADATAG